MARFLPLTFQCDRSSMALLQWVPECLFRNHSREGSVNGHFSTAVYARRFLSVWKSIISSQKQKAGPIRRITPHHFALAVTVILEVTL